MRCIATIQSEHYNPSLPQTEPQMTKQQEADFAKFVFRSIRNALKDPAIREEYNRWLEEQKGKQSYDSNNN